MHPALPLPLFDALSRSTHVNFFRIAAIILNLLVLILLEKIINVGFFFFQTVKALKKKYGGVYTEKNVCISSTHTHSGPGGFLQYALYIVTSQGFVRQSYDALIQGILRVSFSVLFKTVRCFRCISNVKYSLLNM